ncbi:SGNH hydrolase-type esterase domain-containing protein [Tanacetum coccineum]
MTALWWDPGAVWRRHRGKKPYGELPTSAPCPVIAESLGFPFIPPYLHDIETDNAVVFRQGVNYAVAGATALNSSVLAARGILNPLTHASLEVQLEWLKQSLPSICGNVAESLLEGKKVDELESLVPPVIDTIVSAVNLLIAMGAQTLVVPGNFPIGCLPSFLTVYNSENGVYDPTTGCLVRLNEFAEHYNELLLTKLNRIRELHPNVNVIYADYYNAALQIYRSPNKFGFANGALKACCGGGGGPYNFNLLAECGLPSATVCDQPDTYWTLLNTVVGSACYTIGNT